MFGLLPSFLGSAGPVGGAAVSTTMPLALGMFNGATQGGGTIFEDGFNGTNGTAIDAYPPDISNAEGGTWHGAAGTMDGTGTLVINSAADGVRYGISSRKDFTFAVDELITAGAVMDYFVRDDQSSTVAAVNAYRVRVDASSSRNPAAITVNQIVSGSAGSALITTSSAAWNADAVAKIGMVMDASDNLQLQVNGSNVGGSAAISGVSFGVRMRASQACYVTNAKAG